MLMNFFKKCFAVTMSPFCGPLILSVLDFGWLHPWVLKTGWMHHCLYSLLLACNGSLESTLISLAKTCSQFHTLVWWGYHWSDCPMSLLGLLTDSNPWPHGSKPDALPTELSQRALLMKSYINVTCIFKWLQFFLISYNWLSCLHGSS